MGFWANCARRWRLGAGIGVGLTALCADRSIAQIVSRNWLPKRYALGPMAPLNLRFAAGRLCQQERGDVDGV